MKKIKPSAFDVSLIYECPDCKLEHFSTINETIFPAGILCYCGKKLRLESIYGFDVICDYNKKGTQEPEPEEDNNSVEDEVVCALVSLGFKEHEAKSKAKEAVLVSQDLEECLKYAIS